jgi:transposase
MTKAEQTRLTSWRLKVLQRAAASSRSVARTCRHFGISRRAFYKWKRRYAEHGEAGLCDRPRRPHRSPRATTKEVVSKILHLRQNYHFGPGKIADYLKRPACFDPLARRPLTERAPGSAADQHAR